MKLGILLGICLLLCAGCTNKPTGPKFDPRAKTKTQTVTNLTQVAATNKLDDSLLRPWTNQFTLGPGDKIEIEVLGDPASRMICTIGPDGRIYYNLAPGLDVWGMSLDEAKQAIEKELEPYVTGAQVSITVRAVESQRVWILGRLQNSGVYPMPVPMTLLEAVSQAGGALSSSAGGTTEELADLRHGFVIRDGNMLPVNFEALLLRGDMTQNIYLKPDDFIYIPSALNREVYVLGAVRTPRLVNMLPQMTLISAIAGAGGTVKDAHLSQVAIVRGSLTKPEIAVVDYQEIVKGRAPDILLERGDIVYVPLTPYRYIQKYADLILTTFVRSVAINEGARAAVPGAAPAGVAIGIGTAR